MTKILILNVGWLNKGNNALVISTMETIKQFILDADFVLMGPRQIDNANFHVKEQLCFGLTKKKPYYYIIRSTIYILECIMFRLLQKIGFKIQALQKSKLLDYHESDIIINSGGDTLSGEYGFASLGSLINIIYGLLLGKPVVLYSESLGYFRNPLLNCFAKLVLNRTKLILVRESISKEYLEKNNIKNPYIYTTTDAAFLLEKADRCQIIEILNRENIEDVRKPIIGINPSGLISRFGKKNHIETEAEFIRIFSVIVDNLIENLGATILFIPHVYTANSDDRVISRRIYSKIKNKKNAKLIEGEYSPQELKGIIGLCDLFIGARMHAVIASTSLSIPTIGIAYSHKMHGIIGITLDLEHYIIDISDLNYENLYMIINEAWNNKNAIRRDLDLKIPILKELARKNGQYVKDVLIK